jgi:hypothetical protein
MMSMSTMARKVVGVGWLLGLMLLADAGELGVGPQQPFAGVERDRK